MWMKGDSIICRSWASLKAPEPPRAWQQWSSPAHFRQRKPSISSGRGCPPPCPSSASPHPYTSICCPDSQLPSCAPVSPCGSFDTLPFCSREKSQYQCWVMGRQTLPLPTARCVSSRILPQGSQAIPLPMSLTRQLGLGLSRGTDSKTPGFLGTWAMP